MEEIQSNLLANLKKLQDLKFEIYIQSNLVDYHQFDILTLTLTGEIVALDKVYQQYKNQYTITKIAKIIVDRYKL